MKIIGLTHRGYLVEMTEGEIKNAGGYHAHDIRVPGYQHRSQGYSRDGFAIGCEIKVSDGFLYLHNLRTSEDGVRKSRVTLEALTQLLEQGLPSTIIPADIENAMTILPEAK